MDLPETVEKAKTNFILMSIGIIMNLISAFWYTQYTINGYYANSWFGMYFWIVGSIIYLIGIVTLKNEWSPPPNVEDAKEWLKKMTMIRGIIEIIVLLYALILLFIGYLMPYDPILFPICAILVCYFLQNKEFKRIDMIMQYGVAGPYGQPYPGQYGTPPPGSYRQPYPGQYGTPPHPGPYGPQYQNPQRPMQPNPAAQSAQTQLPKTEKIIPNEVETLKPKQEVKPQTPSTNNATTKPAGPRFCQVCGAPVDPSSPDNCKYCNNPIR
jgi:Ca2+/Na+ antiporter